MKPSVGLAAAVVASQLAALHPRVIAQTPVLRVAVTTVQVDAVVTDGQGRQVTDLGPNDFEVLQDGRLQSVSTFVYVREAGAEPETAASPATTTVTTAPAAGAGGASTPDFGREGGRTFVVVVDDLSLSPESMLRTRDALRKLVDTHFTPTDRVAIVRTGGGTSLSQQFTTDKAVLRQLVDRLRFNARQFERDDVQAMMDKERLRSMALPQGAIPEQTPEMQDAARGADLTDAEQRLGNRAFGAGVIGTLQSVVGGLRNMPGRKGIILLTDGFAISKSNGETDPAMQLALNRLADQATRARAVIYSVTLKPYEWMNTASADFGNPLERVEAGEQADRQTQIGIEQRLQVSEGPGYLATQTGGFFFRNPSDADLVLTRSLEDQRGHYLLGYSPDAKTLDEDRRGRPFHKLTVRVKRRGLSVRSRKGFLGGTETRPVYPPSALVDAAVAPFAAGTLDLRLTGFFAGRWRGASIVRALVYLDARALEFQSRRSNANDAYVELLALITDERGDIVKRDRQMYRLRSREDERSEGGLVYRIDVPVDKPGPYGLRVAVREVATNRMGSANQFVVVPDLDRRELALSGVVLSAREGAADLTTGTASSAHPAVRRFSVPAEVAYTFQIFNARYASPTGKPSLHAVVRLLRDGRIVYTAPGIEVQTETKAGEPVSAFGSLALGPQTAPGDYSLSVTVTDALAPKEHAAATSVIDFTVDAR